MVRQFVGYDKSRRLGRAADLIHFNLATAVTVAVVTSASAAAVSVAANAEDYKKSDDHKPNDLVVKKFAKAVHIIPDVLSSVYYIMLQRLFVSTLIYYDDGTQLAT